MTAYILTVEAEPISAPCPLHPCTVGGAQVRRYVSALERGIADLAEGKGRFKDMSALHPGLRMSRCEHNCVFCLPREEPPALIMAIFHERVDLMKRLAGRLDE